MQVADATLSAVRIHALADIRRAAEAMRNAVAALVGLRVHATHNIADSAPMKDAAGVVLADSVFGADGDASQWWEQPQLALTSPLPMACRFESEPFWCNAQGIRTRSQNVLLEAIDLSDFEARALTRAAIVAPIHLPFGQIGAASFVSPDTSVDDLSQPYAMHGDALASIARVFIASYVKVTERRPARVGAVDPAGKTLLDRFPRHRIMSADALDPILLYFCSAASGQTTGSVFTIDDGQTL